MADKFRVGQKVRIIRADHGAENLKGQITFVKAPESLHYGANTRGELAWCWGYEVDLFGPDGGCWVFHGSALEPVYDGDQAATWETSAWKPNEHPAVEPRELEKV